MDLQLALEKRAKVEAFPRKHPVGLLTLLFTNLVGSTKLKQELSEQVMQRLRDRRFHFHFEHAAYDAALSQWWIKPCRAQIRTFLKERFLTLGEDRLPRAPKQTAKSRGENAAAGRRKGM
jgi:hypothetical protein